MHPFHNLDVSGRYPIVEQEVRHWFDILNRELFEGVLTEIRYIDIRRRRGCHAYYSGAWFNFEPTLFMRPAYESKRLFVQVLGHELVHHYQHLHDQDDDHGESFLAWIPKFSDMGLDLCEEY